MPKVAMPLYFAYGSNMARETMKAKCLDASVVGPACLDGYRLAFNRRSIRTGTGVANVVPDPRSAVWGVLYDISESCLDVLDRKEGNPWAYERRHVDVRLESGEGRSALTYVVSEPETEDVPPSADYLNRVIAAAREQHLPTAYIESLRAFLRT